MNYASSSRTLWSCLSSSCLGKVLNLLEKAGISPSKKWYGQVMSKCGQMKALSEARSVHAHLVRRGLELDSHIGSGIVAMYVKCGSLVDALQIHKKLPERNEFSWSALISGYANCEQGGEALRIYREMREDGVKPSGYTFLPVLKACGSLRDLETGKQIHAHLIESGNDADLFVATALVDMYAKCGSMVDALQVFHKLPHRDVVAWTAMILGYAQNEQGGLALQFYAQMRQEGVVPDERTLLGALKACSRLAASEEDSDLGGKFVKIGCLQKVRAIHSEVLKGSFESSFYVASMLVSMYAKCGSMVDARLAFDELRCRDVVLWNVMILGYVQKDESEVALELYARMQQEGLAPDRQTFVGALKACSSLAALEEETEVCGKFMRIGCLEKGRAVHVHVVKLGLEHDLFVAAALVGMYSKCGSMEDARHVFGKLPHRNIACWTSMILGYAQKEQGEVAMQLYGQMQEEGFAPDERTFVAGLKACAWLAAQEEGVQVDGKLIRVGCLEKGRAIHAQVVKVGFETNVYVATMLADVYAKCGSMMDARLVFDCLPGRNFLSWNVMIQGYADQGQCEEAFELYEQMKQQGLSENRLTLVSILKACGNRAALETGKKIHAGICSVGFDGTQIVVANALINMYGKCGSMVDAQLVFDAMPKRDVVTWNSLLSGYARQGESALVFHLFQRMRQNGTQPNEVTFLTILTVCSHAGLVEKGQEYFYVMSKHYGITPMIKHYNCMVDVLARAGQMDQAVAFVEKMPFDPNPVTWMTLLGACQKWTIVEAGRLAFEHLVRLDKYNAGAYFLMSNIYADANMWEARNKIQAIRKSAGAWKKPGQSWWTETGGFVHTFVAGDARHQQINHIYAKLKDLSQY